MSLRTLKFINKMNINYLLDEAFIWQIYAETLIRLYYLFMGF